MQDNFDQTILEKLKAEKISPKPRWYFTVKNYALWGMGILSLVIGGLSFSVIIYLVRNNDWQIYNELDGSLAEFILLSMPYFWIIILALFLLFIYYDIRQTKKGYRYPILWLFTGSVVVSILCGSLFFTLGMGQYIDDILGQKAPFYNRMVNPQFMYWDRPDEGRLIGVIISESRPGEYIIKDIRQKEWMARFDERVMLPPGGVIIGQPFRLFGEMMDNVFIIHRVKPVGPGRGMFRRDHMLLLPSPAAFYFEFEDNYQAWRLRAI